MEIAKTLEEATPALNYEIPLPNGDERYTDFSKVRGDIKAMARIRKSFERQFHDEKIQVVFASHRGAGKTTELMRLSGQLKAYYETVYFEASVEMDSNRFEMEDLLLVIARFIELKMRELNKPLDDILLKNVENWFSEVVLSHEEGKKYLAGVHAEAKLEGGMPFFARLMASLTASFKLESTHRETVKQVLKKYTGALMEHVNVMLNAANSILSNEGKKLLLIIDNMDRYNPQIIDELLVKSTDMFKRIACHLIVTPPISLVLRPESSNLSSDFECITMPTIRLRRKDQPYDAFEGLGYECLLLALKKRIDVDKLIPDKKTVDKLIAASGGSIREMLRTAREATLEADGEYISDEDMTNVLKRKRSTMGNIINFNGWWEPLIYIAKNKKVSNENAFLQVLFQRLAYQYNGEVWYDVHPLITELPEFQERMKREAVPGKEC